MFPLLRSQDPHNIGFKNIIKCLWWVCAQLDDLSTLIKNNLKLCSLKFAEALKTSFSLYSNFDLSSVLSSGSSWKQIDYSLPYTKNLGFLPQDVHTRMQDLSWESKEANLIAQVQIVFFKSKNRCIWLMLPSTTHQHTIHSPWAAPAWPLPRCYGFESLSVSRAATIRSLQDSTCMKYIEGT